MICVSESDMKIITEILRSHISNGEVRAFGSRYKWTSKDYSDLNIAVAHYDKKSMPIMKLAEIREEFGESELPYKVDVLDYWGISSEFQAVIDEGYEVIYRDDLFVDIHYVLGSVELLDNVKPLWEELNKLQLQKSTNFKDFFSKNTFEERKKKLLAIAQKGPMLTILAYEKDLLIGYCIASVADEVGEINSLFVSETHRNCGIATYLMDISLNWLKQKNPSKTVVKVSTGNEVVFEFYAKYGLLPRFTELEMISK